jgi:hypothetical protein
MTCHESPGNQSGARNLGKRVLYHIISSKVRHASLDEKQRPVKRLHGPVQKLLEKRAARAAVVDMVPGG